MKKLLLIIAAIATLTACTATNTVTEEELGQGWYYAQEDAKKEGTPDEWTFLEDGDNSKWIKPPVESMLDY